MACRNGLVRTLALIQPLGIKAELSDLGYGIVLVIGFNESVGLLAAGVNRRIGEFGHNRAGFGWI
jgi:hypothetical protein